jgi:hypothetical protein
MDDVSSFETNKRSARRPSVTFLFAGATWTARSQAFTEPEVRPAT